MSTEIKKRFDTTGSAMRSRSFAVSGPVASSYFGTPEQPVSNAVEQAAAIVSFLNTT
jgi:hypothetical protein